MSKPYVVVAVLCLAILGATALIAYLHRELRSIRRLPSAIRSPNGGGFSKGDEALNRRLSIVSVWANVLTLSLITIVIAIVGLSQVGLELWRPGSGENAYLSTAALEDLLRSRLPDAGTLAQQHKDILEALRGDPGLPPISRADDALQARLSDLQSQIDSLRAKGGGQPLPEGATVVQASPEISSFLWWMLVFLAVLIGTSALAGVSALIARSVSQWRNKQKIAAAATVVTAATATLGSVVGGFVLFKSFDVIGKADSVSLFRIENHYQSPEQPAPQPVDFHLRLDLRQAGDIAPAKMDCQRIGPFDDGGVALATDEEDKISGIAKSIVTRRQTDYLTAIMFKGSADKRPLKPATAARYSSNEGLAQARIAVVRKLLLAGLGTERPQMLESYGGPSMTEAALPVGALASDRAVEVCVFWSPKLKAEGDAVSPLPVRMGTAP